MGKQYPYKPVSEYSEERLAHKRHWDRIRQRECRSKKRKQAGVLEEELRDLKSRFEALEGERDDLLKTVRQQAEAMESTERETKRLRSVVEIVVGSLRESQASLQAALKQPTEERETTSPVSHLAHPAVQPSMIRPSKPAELRATDDLSGYSLSAEGQPPSDAGSLPDLSLTIDSFSRPSFDEVPMTPSIALEEAGTAESSRTNSTGSITETDIPHGWDRLPLNTAPMGYIDHGISDLERLCRHIPTQEVPIAELNAQAFPHISNLLNPEVPSHSLQHPLSSLIIDRVMQQMPLPDMIGRLAAMWVICTVLRWRVCRTPKTYLAIPDFLRPTEIQLSVPHPIWADVLVWPEGRTAIIKDFDMTRYTEFREDLNKAVSVGWTRPSAEAITQGSTPGEQYLSVEFVRHLSDLKNWTLSREKNFPGNALEPDGLRITLLWITIGLDLLHQAGVVHTDLSPNNVLVSFQPGEERVFEQIEELEMAHPTPRKVLPDRCIYRSYKLGTTHGPAVITDFGASRIGDPESPSKHSGDVMPGVYRAPEIIMGGTWDSKIDMWSLGVMIWDLFEGGPLFHADRSGTLDDEVHLAEMVSLLGPPPKAFLERYEHSQKYWDPEGKWIASTPVPEQSLETRETRLQGEEKLLLLELVRKLLCWLPEDRKSAEGLYDEPFIQGYARE
ncbi:protein kinase domain-containing protein [Sarocladium implicatum]|nr:protein kinase domain-containing protein [Sarocladium implicatum]